MNKVRRLAAMSLLSLMVIAYASAQTPAIPSSSSVKVRPAGLYVISKKLDGTPSQGSIFGIFAGGTAVAFHLTPPAGKGILDVALESGTIARFDDHKGRSLLPPAQSTPQAHWGTFSNGDRVMTPMDGTVVDAVTPLLPAKGATSFHIAGTLMLTMVTGLKDDDTRHIDVVAGPLAALPGWSIEKAEIPAAGANPQSPFEVTFKIPAGEANAVESLKFTDGNQPLESHAVVQPGGTIRTQFFKVPHSSLDLIVERWIGLQQERLKIDQTIALGSVDR
jgi:hypothetical protein